MSTQYNPNPNGTSTSAGWESKVGAITFTPTVDGMRVRAAVNGNNIAAQEIDLSVSVSRLSLAGVSIRRVGSADFPQRIEYSFPRVGGGVYTQDVQLRGVAYAADGAWLSLPPIIPPSGVSPDPNGVVAITLFSVYAFDVQVKGLYLFASSATELTTESYLRTLDASDATWSATLSPASLAGTLVWNGAANELVQTLRWKDNIGTISEGWAGVSAFRNLAVTFPTAGTYTIGLEARNDLGGSYTTWQTLTVPSGPYAAAYAHEADYLHLEVDASASVGARIDTYQWTWGDGQSTTATAANRYASHDYAMPGTYSVTLTVANGLGQSASITKPITVQAVPSTAVDFTVLADKLTLSVVSVTEGVAYGWQFGDGATASGATAVHTYATAGTYTVTLTVDGVSTARQVTVTEGYAALDVADSLRLEVKQDLGEALPWNRLDNPSGALGASGWRTPVTTASPVVAGPQGLTLTQGAAEGVPAAAHTVRVPIMPGRYVVGSFELVAVDSPCYVRCRVYFTNDAGAEVGSTTITGYQNTPGTYWTGPTKAPSTARFAEMALVLYGSAGVTVPATGKSFTWRRAMVASSLYLSEATNPPYTEAGRWSDVIGPTHEIETVRSELDVSTLSATILDADLDPAVADTLRPGAAVRWRAATDQGGLRVWEPLYTGRISEAAVSYGKSPLTEAVLRRTELSLNPTLTASTNTYEVLTPSQFALVPTVDGGRITLTGYGTSNTYYFACCLKVPVRPGRGYRIRVKGRRVSGGTPYTLQMYLRAFNSLDQDVGDVYADRIDPPESGNVTVPRDLAWQIASYPVGEWRDSELYVHPEEIPAGAATMNLWFCPQGDGTNSPNGVYTLTDVSVVEEWTPPAGPVKRKSTAITLTAVDAATTLAQRTEPRGVSLLQDIPALMEDSGVPVVVDGATNTNGDPAPVAYNENATLLDQVVAARDSQSGYAHVSRAGVLTLNTPAGVSTVPVATLDESVWSEADVRFATTDAINSLLVSWLRYDPAAGDAGETIETQYGPFEDLESVRRWGLRRETVTWQGLVENSAAIAAQAAEVLDANATPVRRVHSVTVPIRYATDLAPGRALLDLMELVRVKHTRTGLDQLLRVTELRHKVTARRGRRPLWTMTVGFNVDGAVARPVAIPSPPVAIPAAQEGVWLPISFGASWVNYSPTPGYAPCEYMVETINGVRWVTLQGLAKTSIARTATSTIGTAYPPKFPRIFNMATSATTTSGASSAASSGGASTGTAHTHTIAHTHVISTVGSRVDVTATGAVNLSSTAALPLAANGFVSLDGIRYQAADA